MAKTKLKALVDKGLDGQSCFGSPDVGDVESTMSNNSIDPKQFSCFGSPDVGDVESRFWTGDRNTNT